MNWLLLLLLLPLGYGSGGGFGRASGFFSPIIGLIFGILFGVSGWPLILFALAGWISEKPSPARNALGQITDGYGRRADYLRMARRGLIGAVPYLPLMFFAPTWIMLAFIPAWPASVFIGTKMPGFSAWQWSEILRYFIVGIVVAIAG